jgi:hypothetical protein
MTETLNRKVQCLRYLLKEPNVSRNNYYDDAYKLFKKVTFKRSDFSYIMTSVKCIF